MSNHSLLKRPGSSSSNRDRRVSWGEPDVVEFSKNETPSKMFSSEETENQMMPESLSPAAVLPATPIHHQPSFAAFLSPVSEEDHGSNTSISSPFNSQTSMGVIFPELEPYVLPNLSWKLPFRARNLNKTPKKNFQKLKNLENLRSLLESKKVEITETLEKVDKFKNLNHDIQKKVKNSAKIVNDWLSQENQKKAENEKKFKENQENLRKSLNFPNFDKNRWIFLQSSEQQILKFRTFPHENKILSHLVLLYFHDSISLELIQPFHSKSSQNIWPDFKKFMECQSFGSFNEMLKEFSFLWFYFVKFLESLEKLESLSFVSDVQSTEDFFLLTGDVLGLKWQLAVNFHNISNEWDVLSRLELGRLISN
jgi:hypothetical protein